MENEIILLRQQHVKNLQELRDRLLFDKIVKIKDTAKLTHMIAVYIESTNQFNLPLWEATATTTPG